MNEFTDLRACPTPSPADTPDPAAEGCRHDCAGCIEIFEEAQRWSEALRIELLHEHDENYALWQQARSAIARTLDDIAPLRRAPGTPGHTDEFVRGWNAAVDEIERRVRELRGIL